MAQTIRLGQVTSITSTETELNLLDGVTGTLVTEAGTQTLTNKSISGSQINSGTIPDARIQSSGVTQHQGSITGTGALNSGSITSGFGAIDVGSSAISTTGTVTLNAITKAGTNGVGNIGASGQGFNTVFAKATSAQYADLAENYASDRNYDPGTVVVLGGDQEVTQCSSFADTKVAGVVSTNPAHLMNSHIQAEYPIAVALTGRVPCKVVGPVNKGDILVTSDINGHAVVCSTPITGSIVGKSIETKTSEDAGIVEVLVGRF